MHLYFTIYGYFPILEYTKVQNVYINIKLDYKISFLIKGKQKNIPMRFSLKLIIIVLKYIIKHVSAHRYAVGEHI